MMSRMRLNGLKDDVAINTSLLKVFFIVGKFDETVEHLREMVSHRMKPDVKAYGVVVNEYCKIRKPSEAVLLLREMVVRGVKPMYLAPPPPILFKIILLPLMNWHHLLQPTREGCLPRRLPPAKAAPFVLHLEATHPHSFPPLSSKNDCPGSTLA
ncbi:Pentatricopeptide repeat-containing protein [Glycine soja]|uniref:Pentatricopeptide repeat-containing protein n=1 Tax=Glycine soja TaxID=3848 RepID=A0A0B2RK16_GLYSO|nr:Pentatricopeptide repeat-containing protein [Glycine soja]